MSLHNLSVMIMSNFALIINYQANFILQKEYVHINYMNFNLKASTE